MIGGVLVGGVLAVYAALLSLASLSYFAAPYLWIAVIWASVFFCGLVVMPRARTLWISLATLLCALAAAEGSSWVSATRELSYVRKEGTFAWVRDDLLGYVAAKGVSQTETKFYRGKKLYDVVYSMDANGLRISSPHAPSPEAKKRCVLFFGDSYTFGWGLNDKDTMPYRVAVRSDEQYRVYNLAFMTHGAHQMLAALEHGLTTKVVDCAVRDVKYVIYSATSDHVRRAAGLREMDLYRGPRYVLGADGGVSYQGQFGAKRSEVERIERLLTKSFFYRRLVGGDAIYYRRTNSKDVALYLAIVDSARRRVKGLYPDAEFHVLFWGNDALGLDKDGWLAKQMLDGLREEGLSVHLVNDILPGADDNSPDYLMVHFSLHPNAEANDRIGEYVAQRILKQ